MDQNEKRNLWIAIVLSSLVLVGWHYFFDRSSLKRPPATIVDGVTTPVTISNKPVQKQLLDRTQALQGSQRVIIDTPSLTGSINLKGAKIDDLVLKKYRETTDLQSDPIRLLEPEGTANAYYAEFGWLCPQNKKIEMPDAQALWTANGTTLTPEKPLTLRHETVQGLVFEQIITVDQDYLFTINQRVRHTGKEEISVQNYGLIARHGVPATQGFFILHEGPIGYLNQKLVEISYKDLAKTATRQNSQGGWLGMTDKYWLVALLPAQENVLNTSFQEVGGVGQERFQADFLTAPHILKPGDTKELTTHFFAGAKVLKLLERYEQQLGVPHFDRAVDFGWFYLLTQPIFHILTWMHQWLGNFGLAIMLLTVILKLAFFPLANKSYRSMAQMRLLQPELERLRNRYGEDKLRLNQEIMAFYKKQKVNPVAGCLPMIVQIPVFFALYKVLFVSIEMRQAPFYGWIHDLSAPDPSTIFNLFGLISWHPPSFLMLGAWPLIMGVTMFVQQRLNPPPVDPAQAKIFMLMPLIFTYMLSSFPAGLVIYWTWNNILTIAQQWTIMRLAAQEQKEKKGYHLPSNKN